MNKFEQEAIVYDIGIGFFTKVITIINFVLILIIIQANISQNVSSSKQKVFHRCIFINCQNKKLYFSSTSTTKSPASI